ncbi:venom serine carboxypeptidase-like [Bacillus rossius redtenbacheri]|uniref:venom serine carboxypeptidase-like n=1 Tax=Bacillus rossius redtenbacheri TaxID=93214 RepID=UPI002FDDEEB4
MFASVVCVLVLGSAAVLAKTLPGFLPRTRSEEHQESHLDRDVGTALILTSYIEAGQIGEARNKSKVTGSLFHEDIPSYSGFFTVNSTYDSNLFFWFFPAEHDYENAPVLLWLQGGPGLSAMYGLFNEVGPFSVSEDLDSLISNPYSWHKNHSLIFIDNPVGTGFSYTQDDAGYSRNDEDVGRNLYSALLQFFALFPELQRNDFFIAGESYAGKYIPALGHTIHVNNQNASLKINLKGLAIGDGLVDPINMLHFSDLAYQWGLVDNRTWSKMQGYEYWAAIYIENNDYELAQLMWKDVLELFEKETGVSKYNVLEDAVTDDETDKDFINVLQREDVRAAIHVGGQRYAMQSDYVSSYLVLDAMRSARPWLEALLDAGYRAVLYSGQLDVMCGYPLTERALRALQFSGTGQYRTAPRLGWRAGGRLAGYTKTAGNLTEVMVRAAGHMVAADQPRVAFHLIHQITRDLLP